jgi:cytidine deaminase
MSQALTEVQGTAVAFSRALERHGLSDSFHITSAVRTELMTELGDLSTSQLLDLCVGMAQNRCRVGPVVPVSKFRVAAAALGASGDVHMGVNVEFANTPLSNTIHAEQFLVIGALQRGETKLVRLATSAPPCGFCRQFLNELPDGGDMLCQICSDGEPHRVSASLPSSAAPQQLAELLPRSFGPADLFAVPDASNNILNSSRHHNLVQPTQVSTSDSLAAAALAAANRSYCPYSHRAAGIALETADGQVHSGWSLENAAYNPTLSPLAGAIVALMCNGGSRSGGHESGVLHGITRCILMEGDINNDVGMSAQPRIVRDIDMVWQSTVAQIFRSIAPAVRIHCIHAVRAEAQRKTGGVDTSCTDSKSDTTEDEHPPTFYVTPQLAPTVPNDPHTQNCSVLSLSPRGADHIAMTEQGQKRTSVQMDGLNMCRWMGSSPQKLGLDAQIGQKKRRGK